MQHASLVTIAFKEEDFVGNTYSDNSDCALVRAVTRVATGCTISASGDSFYINHKGLRQRIDISQETNYSIIEKYSNANNRLPSAFSVELPSEFVKEALI